MAQDTQENILQVKLATKEANLCIKKNSTSQDTTFNDKLYKFSVKDTCLLSTHCQLTPSVEGHSNCTHTILILTKLSCFEPELIQSDGNL